MLRQRIVCHWASANFQHQCKGCCAAFKATRTIPWSLNKSNQTESDSGVGPTHLKGCRRLGRLQTAQGQNPLIVFITQLSPGVMYIRNSIYPKMLGHQGTEPHLRFGV